MEKKYSYVSLLTNDAYSYGIILLSETLKQVNSKYPLHVLITKDISTPILTLLDQLDNVSYEIIDIIPISDEIYEFNKSIDKALAATWKDCWTKFKIFDLVQFDKIVFLDADIMILKNLDHLFDKPHMTSALDGEYFNLWPNWPHFNTGVLVLEPNHNEFQNILNYAYSLTINDMPDYVFADQELLNFYYKDWPNKPELHLNKYYDIFPPYIQDYQIQEIEEKCYFLHFVGRKPWAFWLKTINDNYTEYFYTKSKEIIINKVSTLDWAKIKESLVLTVYAICKNEINNVEKWLNSFSEADHVCILDTGSTDGTWEYLQQAKEKFSNLIIDQQIVSPWRYDKARNLSMELIPKDTIIFFMADLDELIKEKGWSQKVKEAWDPQFSRGIYDYHRDLDDNGNIIRTIKEYRIHSRDWTHWVNIVHEAIAKDNGEKRFFMDACNKIPIEVWHYSQEKENNYMELCEQDLKEYPDDWIMRLQLAIEYEIRKEYDKAVEHFRYILSHDNNLQNFEVARCFNGLGRQAYRNKNYKAAEQCFLEGRITCDFFADNYIEAMEMYYNLKQYQKALDLGKIAIKRCTTAQWCGNYDIKNYYIYYLMGLIYYQLNQPLKGIGYLYYAYNRNPNDKILEQINSFCVTTSISINDTKSNIEI